MAAPQELVVVDLKDIRMAVTKDRTWLGFPHYVVLGWALMVTYTLWNVVKDGEVNIVQLTKANASMAEAITELQAKTKELREDSIKTRMILELKFPRTAQQVDDAFEPELP